ncbi:Uma2 family endonuclease [Nocardia iowensis]|uniref:Uma2 family endonuclease n=1 Tax=Nocardia iowensis TaxID=204891 RepID=A0ABX8RQ64_NOCIO|nr:Uma2 family endonuclease [Nocardia iowensis]QXN91773.1 Uma2 family endonuclease [Nocardia iowensis]
MTSGAPSDWYRWIPAQITARDYELLPEDFCRTIEVVDGHIVKCESTSRLHDRVARRVATQLEAGRKPEPCLMVETDVDVRISDVPLSLRRPDVTVYRCLDDDAKLYAGDAVLVVEIVSPDSSFHTDTVEKKAAYAAAGIPVYLIVFPTEAGDGIELIEEYRLSEGRYHLVCLHTRRLTLDSPVAIDAMFSELTSG